MSKIVNLAEHRPHIAGEARCMACQHTWVAVAEQGTPALECPSCGCLKGVWAAYCLASDGENTKAVWHCGQCDNIFFVLHKDRIMCANCGEPQRGMWD